MKKRKTVGGILIHCYQRSAQGQLLFYSVSDYLVFFTILCSVAGKYDIRILSVSLMPDHFHISLVVTNPRSLHEFISVITQMYAREFNRTCHTKGQLFQKSFGSAMKFGAKNGRSNLIYVGNNGVERQLCKKAEDYRWGFLKYHKSQNPFSEPLVVRNASPRMVEALKCVQSYHSDARHLNYRILQRLFTKLNVKEKEQLADYIIVVYNVIDYEGAAEYFDGFDKMIDAMHFNTGSEYDLNEITVGRSDAHYNSMSRILIDKLGLKDIHDVFMLPEEIRFNELFPLLQRHTAAQPEQILKFLRLPFFKK